MRSLERIPGGGRTTRAGMPWHNVVLVHLSAARRQTLSGGSRLAARLACHSASASGLLSDVDGLSEIKFR